jgi:hypothetical protein
MKPGTLQGIGTIPPVFGNSPQCLLYSIDPVLTRPLAKVKTEGLEFVAVDASNQVERKPNRVCDVYRSERIRNLQTAIDTRRQYVKWLARFGSPASLQIAAPSAFFKR